ncbi:MAG: hypothetical protein R3277_12160, partial [Brumimicrobium sp.]|nr:hypothetical protein [Brumimicrobium sp.]
MKSIITAALITLSAAFGFSQSTKVWVTVNDTSILKQLNYSLGVTGAKQALPASRNNVLRKVFEFEIEGNTAPFLRFIETTAALTNPEIIEDFELMMSPNDYNLTFAQDYALDLIGAQEAWNITQG